VIIKQNMDNNEAIEIEKEEFDNVIKEVSKVDEPNLDEENNKKIKKRGRGNKSKWRHKIKSK